MSREEYKKMSSTCTSGVTFDIAVGADPERPGETILSRWYVGGKKIASLRRERDEDGDSRGWVLWKWYPSEELQQAFWTALDTVRARVRTNEDDFHKLGWAVGFCGADTVEFSRDRTVTDRTCGTV